MLTKALMLTALTAAIGFAQGALSERSSYYNTPTYKDVTKVGTGAGWLAFDAKNELRFVPKKGEEVRIPYKAIKDLEYEKAMQAPPQEQEAKKSKWSLPVKMNFMGKHQVVIHYEAPYGQESATLWLDPSNYQNILGTLHAKTGLPVKRTGEPW